jgi:hexosaminidase
LKLLPYPRYLERQAGVFMLPRRTTLELDEGLSRETSGAVMKRLALAAREIGVELTGQMDGRTGITATKNSKLPGGELACHLTIDAAGVVIEFADTAGLWAAVATLRQLLREYGRRLPRLRIRDWPDFPRRGVMLDVSRGRVPKLETLLWLVDLLADFKINEFQLYTEHTFAYRKYPAVWRGWGALTGTEMEKLDAHCRALGIELVPNQNSFGHLRSWLEQPGLKKLAEVAEPWEDTSGGFVRRPSTLAPNHPGTLPFLRGLYDELLPHFSSHCFNVGCDETWDLGRGQSRAQCEKIGKSRVYLRFLKKIHREISARGKQMMFWGDIILKHPRLVRELPRKVIALNWGYEAGHPFERQAEIFQKAKVPFYVCPGTSTWMTLIGRHDNAFANLREAARAGRRHGAVGYLIADWGDGGHPQPLAVSLAPYLYGASVSWCAATADEKLLAPVLSRDAFHDQTGKIAEAALKLGRAHQKLNYFVPNLTPLGTVIAAPLPEERELFCRDGSKYYAHIPVAGIRASLQEIEKQRTKLQRGTPKTQIAKILLKELDLAAQMAAESCRFMLWQQLRADGRTINAAKVAHRGIQELRRIERDFAAYWPTRNKGTPAKSTPFLRWRREDYEKGRFAAGN